MSFFAQPALGANTVAVAQSEVSMKLGGIEVDYMCN
ncbi:hypothetical protein PS862_04019 [Pseudomonas fluorescens]|uniref:Uncharacterized protein n=1 Tax=Pseudomonas fluorescens TaxID=294 RepID=A0A5E7MHW7_PSEFL|nr:hypothetical protein PS862_04019 [Pseudomonas fluorescens]